MVPYEYTVMADPIKTTFAAGSFAIYAAAFWGHQGFLELCERFKFFQRYKIQKSKYPDPALVRSAYRDVLASHAVSIPLSLWFGGHFFFLRLIFVIYVNQVLYSQF